MDFGQDFTTAGADSINSFDRHSAAQVAEADHRWHSNQISFGELRQLHQIAGPIMHLTQDIAINLRELSLSCTSECSNKYNLIVKILKIFFTIMKTNNKNKKFKINSYLLALPGSLALVCHQMMSRRDFRKA